MSNHKTKHWYDYLRVLTALYLTLGFFNILFAWLGLLCFFIPLLFTFIKGEKPIAINTAAEASS